MILLSFGLHYINRNYINRNRSAVTLQSHLCSDTQVLEYMYLVILFCRLTFLSTFTFGVWKNMTIFSPITKQESNAGLKLREGV